MYICTAEYNTNCREQRFCISNGELVLGLGEFIGNVGRHIKGLRRYVEEMVSCDRNAEGRMLLEFCDEKRLCVANTSYQKKEKRTVTSNTGEKETETDLKDDRK